jgi:hypothetical protein
VPGTVHIGRETEEQARITAQLKHGTGKHTKTVLTPQPSDSVNDPLSECFLDTHFSTRLIHGQIGLLQPSTSIPSSLVRVRD